MAALIWIFHSEEPLKVNKLYPVQVSEFPSNKAPPASRYPSVWGVPYLGDRFLYSDNSSWNTPGTPIAGCPPSRAHAS